MLFIRLWPASAASSVRKPVCVNGVRMFFALVRVSLVRSRFKSERISRSSDACGGASIVPRAH